MELTTKEWRLIAMLVRRRITAEENRFRKKVDSMSEDEKKLIGGKINEYIAIEEKLQEFI